MARLCQELILMPSRPKDRKRLNRADLPRVPSCGEIQYSSIVHGCGHPNYHLSRLICAAALAAAANSEECFASLMADCSCSHWQGICNLESGEISALALAYVCYRRFRLIRRHERQAGHIKKISLPVAYQIPLPVFTDNTTKGSYFE